MRFRRFSSLVSGASLCALLAWAALAMALEIKNISFDRAFSPNGDGSQDSTRITFVVEGETTHVARVRAGVFATAALPDAEFSGVLATLVDSLAAVTDTTIAISLDWFGTDDGGAILPDGFYYLHILAIAGGDTLQEDPARQLEINTAPPTLHSLAQEPSLYFTPLAESGDGIQQLFFTSVDFDTLTDTASARVLLEDPESGLFIEKAILERDPEYVLPQGGDTLRFRLTWNGADDEGLILDGSYRADLVLEDDAGNSPDEASYWINLDALAPSIEVARFGEGGANLLNFNFPPSELPDTLLIRCVERNGMDYCRLDWDLLSGPEWVEGELAQAWLDTIVYRFLVPVETFVAELDSGKVTHRVEIDAGDVPGNTAEHLDAITAVNVRLDGTPPPAPVWNVPVTDYIQSLVTLRGTCDEVSVQIHVYEDGEFVTTGTVDLENEFELLVQLSEGTHEWTAFSEDEAGNLSESSEVLTLSYTPGPAISMPGRFRGLPDEKIQVNTARDAQSVTLRVYTLDGDLVFSAEALGGPREFYIEWNIDEGSSSDLSGGLYIANLCTTLQSGEQQFDRKVVAIVRD